MGQQCNYTCNYRNESHAVVITCMFLYKYNVNTCIYTIGALYQIINLNVSTW